MSKRILIISSSPRKSGNSDLLCESFLRGAQSAGHRVIKISLREKHLHYCIACAHCRTHNGSCVFDDDMAEILEQMDTADILVLATPVYFYSISAQLKTLIDRTFARSASLHGKSLFYLVTAAETDPSVADCALTCLRGFARGLPGATELGCLVVPGVYASGDISTAALEQAYLAGSCLS